MYFVISAIVGLAYGGAAGYLKYTLLWRNLLNIEGSVKMKNAEIMTKVFLGYIINAVVLIVVALAKDILPIDVLATLLGTAIGLSVSGKVWSIQKVLHKIEITD